MTENDKNEIIKCTVSCPECGVEMVYMHEDPNTTRSTGVKKATSGPKALTAGVGAYKHQYDSSLPEVQ
ncbi:MAG: hypothetical protein LUQ34_04060 [Euryarchaeota archaeon]|nr:hypothetical protein [Euryarchaeota archaeon]